MGGCGVGLHLYFTNGETEAGARGRVVPGWVVSVPAHARCRDSHRCPGGPAGARSPGDSRRQGPRAPTSHLGGSGRGGTQSERLWPPRSAGGSPSRAAAPRGLSSGGTRGVSGQRKDPGPPPTPTPARLLARRAYTPGPRRTGKIRSEAAGAAAPRPPAPGGALGAAWPPAGALREGSDPGLRAPSRSLRTREGGRRISLGRRGPTAARSSLPH